MSLHKDAFSYLKPTDKQMTAMTDLRNEFNRFADVIQHALVDGPDKTYVMRLIRTAAMWSHVALTRHEDGGPRE